MFNITINICISDVVASNSVSFVTSSLNITVMLPFPQNVTVAIVTEPGELPWCRPGTSSEHHIYSSVPVQFEAYLLISANLTFHWRVIENDTGETVEDVTVAGIQCYRGQSCTSSVQVCVLLFIL